MSALFEIVPNISEGRDLTVVADAIAAMRAAGARVIDRSSDAVHHRSVITAVGSGSQVVAAAFALARITRDRIDLRAHRGAHPRIGALDVLPFIPLRNATLDDAVTLAHRAGARIWRELGVPSILYGAAARNALLGNLAEARRGEFELLHERSGDPERRLDYGDAGHPSAGAIAIGARRLLIAFNVELESDDLALARRIAGTLREARGGLRTVRALGLRLAPGRVQVSCNLTDSDAVPLYRITELVRRMAARENVAVRGSELIGLIPRNALLRTASAYATESRRQSTSSAYDF